MDQRDYIEIDQNFYNIGSNIFGICTTNASTRIKQVSLVNGLSSGLPNPVDSQRGTDHALAFIVIFTNGNTYEGNEPIELAISGGFGTYPVVISADGTTKWGQNSAIPFMYYQAQFHCAGGASNSIDLSGVTDLSGTLNVTGIVDASQGELIVPSTPGQSNGSMWIEG